MNKRQLRNRIFQRVAGLPLNKTSTSTKHAQNAHAHARKRTACSHNNNPYISKDSDNPGSTIVALRLAALPNDY